MRKSSSPDSFFIVSKNMGKGPLILKCITFNLNAGSGLQIQTDMYLSKCKNTVTLTYCEFGGSTLPSQTSTTAQNCKIPHHLRPNCDQTYLIAGRDQAISENQIMKLVIGRDGRIQFVLSLSGKDTPSFPVFEGSSVSWTVFGCC